MTTAFVCTSMHVLICSVLVISSCSAAVGNYRVQAYNRRSGVSFPSHLPSLHTLAAVMQTVVNRGRIASYTIANHSVTGEGEAIIQYTHMHIHVTPMQAHKLHKCTIANEHEYEGFFLL